MTKVYFSSWTVDQSEGPLPGIRPWPGHIRVGAFNDYFYLHLQDESHVNKSTFSSSNVRGEEPNVKQVSIVLTTVEHEESTLRRTVKDSCQRFKASKDDINYSQSYQRNSSVPYSDEKALEHLVKLHFIFHPRSIVMKRQASCRASCCYQAIISGCRIVSIQHVRPPFI